MSPSCTRVSRSERGSATVVGAAVIVVVLTMAVVGVQLGAAVLTRHRAEASADLAALAAAAYLVAGDQAACDQAERVTDRMATRLVDCAPNGWRVSVRVEATPPGPIDRFGPARATARAGPVEATTPIGAADGLGRRRTVGKGR